MVRLKVVGRREEPTTVVKAGTANGAPQQTEQITIAMLLVQSLGEDDKPLTGSPAGTTFLIPVASLSDVAEMETGQVFGLTGE